MPISWAQVTPKTIRMLPQGEVFIEETAGGGVGAIQTNSLPRRCRSAR